MSMKVSVLNSIDFTMNFEVKRVSELLAIPLIFLLQKIFIQQIHSTAIVVKSIYNIKLVVNNGLINV